MVYLASLNAAPAYAAMNVEYHIALYMHEFIFGTPKRSFGRSYTSISTITSTAAVAKTSSVSPEIITLPKSMTIIFERTFRL